MGKQEIVLEDGNGKGKVKDKKGWKMDGKVKGIEEG